MADWSPTPTCTSHHERSPTREPGICAQIQPQECVHELREHVCRTTRISSRTAMVARRAPLSWAISASDIQSTMAGSDDGNDGEGGDGGGREQAEGERGRSCQTSLQINAVLETLRCLRVSGAPSSLPAWTLFRRRVTHLLLPALGCFAGPHPQQDPESSTSSET